MCVSWLTLLNRFPHVLHFELRRMPVKNILNSIYSSADFRSSNALNDPP